MFIPQSSDWFCFSFPQTQNPGTQNSIQIFQPPFYIYTIEQIPWRETKREASCDIHAMEPITRCIAVCYVRVSVCVYVRSNKINDTHPSFIKNINVSGNIFNNPFIYFLLILDSHLKLELVTGYLSILKLWTFTALSGDSPSRPSAAFVPIFRFPPGTDTILSSAGAKEK